MTIEVICLNNWLEKGTLMRVTKKGSREGRVTFEGVVFQVEPGEASFIDGPDGLGLQVKCNDRDDGGEVTLRAFSIKMEGKYKDLISVSHERDTLSRQLATGESLIVGLDKIAIANIRHTPRRDRIA